MPVSKQNYTVNAPWLNSDLANVFRLAFIDANLMDGWYDQWVTGSNETQVQHRVLRIIYDPNKQYGTVFHWFSFLANGNTAYSYAHQWDLVNKRPTGTARRDYLGNGTYALCESSTSTCSSRRFGTNVNSVTTTLTRYTSGVQSNFSMFLLKGGNNYFSFFLVPPGSTPQSYLDLNINTCGGLMLPVVGSNSTSTNYVSNTISFDHLVILRNSIFGFGRIATRDAYYAIASMRGVAYTALGNGSSTSGWDNSDAVTGFTYSASDRLDNNSTAGSAGIRLPVERASENPNRAANASPVFTDIPFSMYFLNRIPVDFGIAFHFPDSTMEVQDRFQVTLGAEEWEILAVSNYTHPANPSGMLLARVI